MKYKKVVYANTVLLNSYNTAKSIEKYDKISFICRSKRSSDFRGVSKNGNQWQVNIMFNKKKII